MNEQLIVISVAVGAMIVFILGLLFVVAKFFVRVKPNEALVATTPRGRIVMRNGGIVLPLLQRGETIDLSMKTVRIERRGIHALLTKDDERVEVDVVMALRINQTSEDILKVAERVGCEKTYDPKTVEELFKAPFTSAIVEVVRQLTVREVESKRSETQDQILQVLGKDLQGYIVESVAIDRVERAGLESAGPFR
jgi:uncharacterized membrane protein YqiK